MDKKFLMLAVAAITFAACSNDEADSVQKSAEVAQSPTDQVAEQVPVEFGAYVNRATTRAGQAGELTTVNLPTNGFGVFAYYTDNADYSQFSTPNFMYNQQVTGTVSGTTTTWSYSPVKYWPNEYGNDAASDDVDKVSFFAYAPYVAVTPGKGTVDVTGSSDAAHDKAYGIIQVSRNSATGDPMVKYVVDPDPSKSVDLLWAVQPATTTTPTYTPISAGAFTATPGFPYLDLVKSKSNDKIQFDFKHALAKLNVQIDAFVDQTTASSAKLNAAQTRIYVRSITFTGFETQGTLNLNNTEANIPLWLNSDGTSELSGSGKEVVVYDGLKDGKEAKVGSEQKSEKPAMLNPVIIQHATTAAVFPTAGVTETAVNLFKTTSTTPTTALTESIFVIPTYETMDVTIVYDVETIDPNLPGYLSDGETHGSSIENKITKTAVFGTTTNIEAGKAYTLKLHLGMTSVKFDATVSTWDATGTPNDANLPANN